MKIFNLKFSGLLVLLLVAIFLPFLITDYWIYVFSIAYYYTIMAASWNLLGGYTGQFSLGHHTFALIGAYTSTLMILKAGIPLWMGILSGAILTIIVSFVLGFLCLRVRGIYLALITWAFAEVVRIYIRMDYVFTGGDRGLFAPLFFGTMKPLPYYYLFLGLSVFAIILIAAIMRSRIGYYFRAIRNDEIAARAMGVNTVRWKVFAFMVASGLAGLAGAFYGHSIGLISPVLGEFNEMAMIIIFVVIGGMRTQAGPVVGAISIRYLTDLLREWSEIRIVILSAIVIIIMRFFNGGLMELFKRAKQRVQQKGVKEPVPAYPQMEQK
jgi:branched-chain amino acid transport system permease protein